MAPVVIEDCCQSLGTRVDGRPLGSDGDAAVFSFYATKIITGGQGGLVWDPSKAVAEAVHDYRQFDNRQTWEPRFNFQMTDIQAAMVRSQFARLDDVHQRRRQIYARLLNSLPEGLGRQTGLDDAERLPYRFIIRFADAERRQRAKSHFAELGVTTIVPVERFELLHRYLRLDPVDFPVAEKLVDTTLSLPLYPALEDAQVETICRALRGVAA